MPAVGYLIAIYHLFFPQAKLLVAFLRGWGGWTELCQGEWNGRWHLVHAGMSKLSLGGAAWKILTLAASEQSNPNEATKTFGKCGNPPWGVAVIISAVCERTARLKRPWTKTNKTPTKNNQEKPLEMREALLLCCMLAVKCIHSLILVICSLGPTVRNPVDGLQCLPLTSWTSCWWRRKWNTIKVYFSCKSFDIRPSQTANLCLD